MLTRDIISGASYRIKYRAKNFNGWGEISEIAYITAATKPSKPNAPIYISSDSTSITFMLTAPENTSGSPLTGFKLYVDTMSINSNYQLVYSGQQNQVTVTAADHSLQSGTTYRFVLVSTNAFGDSPISKQTRVSFATLPPKPNAPVKNEQMSSLTSIAVEWDKVEDSIPVTGYHLYVDDGYNGDFTLVYNGTNLPFDF